MLAVKVRFDGKVFVPEEPVTLPAGQSCVVHVELAVSDNSAQEQHSVFDWLEENAVADDSLPTDLAHQHNHYLYGTPKEKPQS